MSDYAVALVGKIMCYAICALAMDLIWGYTGILSLGHGMFFALGGYAMGMYLMRQIGRDGNYKSDLPDFMVFLDWKDAALALDLQRQLCHATLILIVRCRAWWPSCSASSPSARASRACIFHHHAGHDLRRHAAVLPQRNRLRRQQRLHRLQAHPGHSDRHAVDAHDALRA